MEAKELYQLYRKGQKQRKREEQELTPVIVKGEGQAPRIIYCYEGREANVGI